MSRSLHHLVTLAAVLCMAAPAAFAQQPPPMPDPPEAGIPADQAREALATPPRQQRGEPDAFGVNTQWVYIHASEFLPRANDVLPSYVAGTGYITPRDPGSVYYPQYWTQIHLPIGAEIGSFYANVYDTVQNADWKVFLTVYEHDGSPSYSYPAVADGALSNGYAMLWAPSFNPILIREYADLDGDGTDGDLAYTFSVEATGTSYAEKLTLRFGGIAVKWRRTISPAPASATFTDVGPTDFGFQHVEALVASGITSGCSATEFCPNAPLTRVQMAVFLAKALGLHWSE